MTATGVISALIIGAIVGALGRLVVPGRQSIPVWLTVLIGIAAALLGSFIARETGVADTAGLDWTELAIQVGLSAVGVLLLLALGGGRRTYT